MEMHFGFQERALDTKNNVKKYSVKKHTRFLSSVGISFSFSKEEKENQNLFKSERLFEQSCSSC